MSLLSIVQKTARLLSVPVPVAVTTSTDEQVLLLWELANEEGEDLQKRHDWQLLTYQHTFTTDASAAQASALPADFDRFLANSMFNRSTMREVIGPITPQQWQAIQAQPQLNRVFLAFRMRAGGFLVTPDPSAGNTVAFEYISVNWAADASGNPKSEFTDDTDYGLLDERLIRLGLRWRFRKSKGLDYDQDFQTYERAVQEVSAADGGMTRLDVTGYTAYNVAPGNIPAGNWPA